MTSEEKKLEMGKNLSAALNSTKIENPANLDPVTRQEKRVGKSLVEIEVEIKFHLNQMGLHAVEIGRLLLEAKEKVAHGGWSNWLEENFNLGQSSANKFMKIAQRFGSNSESIPNLRTTQLITMLALPAGEEEKFMEEKAAEGKPVEEMAVRELREEIKQWKAKLAKAEEEREGLQIANEISERQLKNLDEENQLLKKAHAEKAEKMDGLLVDYANLKEEKAELQEQVDDLNNKLLRREPETVEVAPEDYEPMKKELAETKEANEKLQSEIKELQERPIEYSTEYPADYESTKAELAELKEKQKNLQAEYDYEKKIKELYLSVQDIVNYVPIPDVLKKMEEKNPNYHGEFKLLISYLDVIKSDIEEFLEEKQTE